MTDTAKARAAVRARSLEHPRDWKVCPCCARPLPVTETQLLRQRLEVTYADGYPAELVVRFNGEQLELSGGDRPQIIAVAASTLTVEFVPLKRKTP